MKKVLIENAGQQLTQLKVEMVAELDEIISWWWSNMPRREQPGFYGSLDANDIPDPSAPNGIVLNSRILWTFSAAFHFTQSMRCKKMADMAYSYITSHFVDREYGGVCWSVDAEGKMLDGKKQVYGLAFCIYGISEYYRLTGNEEALKLAKDLFNLIERYSYDKMHGGYIEAFTRNWEPAADMRLSDKDDNQRKTMNTHLHVIEAYACLYRVWKDETLRQRIVHLLELFDTRFIDKKSFHLHLFFDDDWTLRSSLQSYGHDIEAGWLLQQCAETAGQDAHVQTFKALAVKITGAAAEGLDEDGGLWYEFDPAKPRLVKEKHWWCQAEAITGFVNAYQLTKQQEYLDKAVACWAFVKNYIRDRINGEWVWGVNGDYSIIPKEKAGFWKCPYHNGRMCMEIISRVSSIDGAVRLK